MTVYEEIFEVIKARKAQYDAGNAPEKSYTCYLFDKGVDNKRSFISRYGALR